MLIDFDKEQEKKIDFVVTGLYKLNPELKKYTRGSMRNYIVNLAIKNISQDPEEFFNFIVNCAKNN